tara:strand:- start:123 stop:404 length:282 start_codon:yes stop_codon:yes gene_type:complete
MDNQNTKVNLQIVSEERLLSLEKTLHEVLAAVKGINKESELPNMLTSDQVMEALNIKRWKFDQLIADGELKYIRKGRKYYVPESAIKEYFGIN